MTNKTVGLICMGTLVVMVLLSGCNTTQAPHTTKPDRLPDDLYPRKVVYGDLKDQIVESGAPIVEEGTATTPLRVTVPIRSIEDKGLNLQYRFEFLDEKGRPTTSDGGWRFIHVLPRTEVFLEGNALSDTAKDWRVQIRHAR